MKEIFRSILGIIFFIGLVQIIKSFIDLYAHDLQFMVSALNGLVFVVILMGCIISFKSGSELIIECRKK